MLPVGVTGRQRSVIVTFPGHLLYFYLLLRLNVPVNNTMYISHVKMLALTSSDFYLTSSNDGHQVLPQERNHISMLLSFQFLTLCS